MHRNLRIFNLAVVGLLLGSSLAYAEEAVKIDQLVTGMPKSEKQQVRVLTATLEPGDKTEFHTHRFPVTLYVLKGAFTLELEGRPTITVKAGEAMVEPPNVKMTGFNRSTTESMQVVTFYVSEPHTPFLDPIR